jgi:hypothetical protein
MEIQEAFTQEAIERMDTNIEGEDELAVRRVIQQVYAANEMDLPDEPEEGIAVLCFVAGRTYQSETVGSIPITMTPEMMTEFMDFLVQKLKGTT